jgi:hypothetical protein
LDTGGTAGIFASASAAKRTLAIADASSPNASITTGVMLRFIKLALRALESPIHQLARNVAAGELSVKQFS